MQMPLVQDQDVIQAGSSHTAQESFTDGIGAFRVIRRCENLDATYGCHSSETRAKLALMIAHEVLRRVSIGSGLPQSLRRPGIGRRALHPDMDDFPRSQFNHEKRKERPKEEIDDLEKVG
jgi:hypothetical protein